MFIGRERELRQLEEFLENSDKRVFCLYGRQGIGKSALLKGFLKEHRGVYFPAYKTTEDQQLLLLQNVLNIKKADSLEAVLNEVTDIAGNERFAFVIDHYGDFAKTDESYAAILHSFLKERWYDNNIKLILCEDSYLTANKLMLSAGAIWQDFEPEIMELKCMDFYDSARFFADATPEEKIFYFGLTGGMPCYLKQVRDDIEHSVENVFLRHTSEMGILPEKQIASELREMSYYNRMLLTLASGKTRVNQIAEDVKKPKDVVVPYLKKLMSIGIVQKENPITEKDNRKKTRYSIVNESDIFWYKFIAPNMDMYLCGDRQRLLSEKIMPNVADYMRQVFIHVCKDYMIKRAADPDFPARLHEVGNWWENDDEKMTTAGFDLVAIGENKGAPAMLFARCFYDEDPIDIATLKSLIDLTRHLKTSDNTYYVIFSKSGFNASAQTAASAIKNIILISMKEVCEYK
ncbi:MAG: hypothetical protein K6B14_09335 [Lachnospiraceae bacterium]|nr:hypothetical protein [Lachnospiraceae bacterium]